MSLSLSWRVGEVRMSFKLSPNVDTLNTRAGSMMGQASRFDVVLVIAVVVVVVLIVMFIIIVIFIVVCWFCFCFLFM